VYLYSQYQQSAPNHAQADFNLKFGNPVVVSPSLTFSPPISMYKALDTALKSDDWNATSLQHMTITISLEYMEFTNSSDSTGFQTIKQVTQPQPSFADKQVNATTTFRYIWSIIINRSQGMSIPPPGSYYIDAQTDEIIPHGILF